LDYEYIKRIYHYAEQSWNKVAEILDINRKTLDSRRKKLEGRFGDI